MYPPPRARSIPAAARTSRFWRAALLALVLLPCLQGGALAVPCPAAPRDWTPKTLEAFAEESAIWKLNDPSIDAGSLADALATTYRSIYHDPKQVPEPTFLERFHDPEHWTESGKEFNTNTFDYQTKDADLQDTILANIPVGNGPKAGWSWGPNPPHNAYDVFKFNDSARRKAAKCRSDGLVLIGYYKWIDKLTGNQRTTSSISKARENPLYLVSIMDLKEEHLEWLKAMKARAMLWLKDAYDVDPADGDTVRMYFHWPTGHPTSTLHLHVRVNWRMSPVEYIHSYMLDDVIRTLEGNKSVATMIAERYKRLGGAVLDGNFTAMTNPDSKAPSSLHNRYFQSVKVDSVRSFSDAASMPADTFGAVKDILRTAQVVDTGTKYYVQRPGKDEKSTNAVRGDKLDKYLTWSPSDTVLFNSDEITRLKLTNYRGTLNGLLGCLLPYFDNATATDCLKISKIGSDVSLERYPSFDEFSTNVKALCPDSFTCYAAKVTRPAESKAQFQLQVTDDDLKVLKGLDKKVVVKGNIDGNDSADHTFKFLGIDGNNIATGTPDKQFTLDTKPIEALDKLAKIITPWIGRFAVIKVPTAK